MKKKLFIRCLIGAPIGLTITTFISMFISLLIQDGNYYAVVPELVIQCGTELNAVILQTLCSIIYGAIWGGASMIWEEENWSILRQTVTHLIVVLTATFLISYLTRWMSISWVGMVSYFCIFLSIYGSIWVFQYLSIKKKIQELNLKIRQNDEINSTSQK